MWRRSRRRVPGPDGWFTRFKDGSPDRTTDSAVHGSRFVYGVESAYSNLVSISEQSTDSLRTWQTAFGLTRSSVRTTPINASWTVTATEPDNTYSITLYQTGRLASVTRYCVVDMEAFARYLAVEVITGHYDGYAKAVNNYRIFIQRTNSDPIQIPGHRIYFIPHGMDQIKTNTATAGEGSRLVVASDALQCRRNLAATCATTERTLPTRRVRGVSVHKPDVQIGTTQTFLSS